LKELTFLSEGVHAKRFQDRRRNTLKRLEGLVASAQENGSIQCREDPAFIARHIFFVYSGAIRWWFASDDLQLSTGIADLRRIFELHLMGLDPTATALGSQQDKRQAAHRDLGPDGHYRHATPCGQRSRKM